MGLGIVIVGGGGWVVWDGVGFRRLVLLLRGVIGL